MAIDSSAAQFLCGARNHGVDFRSMLTIGRQGFCARPDVTERVFKAIGSDASASSVEQQYADAFLAALGAEELAAMDCSGFEAATVIHDLNRPIPAELRNRFGLVYDGGSLEHVFNISQAYKNLMEMVRVGGWFAQITVANNWTGHGFWQVSPETIFRCLSPENGFELHAVLLKEVEYDDAWYVASDPAELGRRVELRNNMATYVAALALKVADVEVFARTPQQSDYAVMWSGDDADAPPPAPTMPAWGARLSCKQRAAMKGTAVALRMVSAFSPACYRHLGEAALLRGDLGGAPSGPSMHRLNKSANRVGTHA